MANTFFVTNFLCLSFSACLLPSNIILCTKIFLFFQRCAHIKGSGWKISYSNHMKNFFYPIFFQLLLLALLLLFSIDYNMCSRCCILSSSLYTKLFLFEFLTVFIFLFLFFLLLGGNTEKNSLCSVIIAAPCIIPYGRNIKDYGN